MLVESVSCNQFSQPKVIIGAASIYFTFTILYIFVKAIIVEEKYNKYRQKKRCFNIRS